MVALGAAVQANILAGRSEATKEMLLLDVTPLSLGIEALGGVVAKIIHRNSTIPASATEHFTTGVEGQTNVAIHVLQGERELAKDCRSLARFDLKGIPPMPAGLPRIEVKFLIDANGIMHVSARELRSGKEAEIEVQPSYGLTDEQVENMILESFDYAEDDFQQRQVIEARNEAETMLAAMEKGRKNPAWERVVVAGADKYRQAGDRAARGHEGRRLPGDTYRDRCTQSGNHAPGGDDDGFGRGRGTQGKNDGNRRCRRRARCAASHRESGDRVRRLSAVGCRLSAAGCRLLVASCGCRFLFAICKLRSVRVRRWHRSLKNDSQSATGAEDDSPALQRWVRVAANSIERSPFRDSTKTLWPMTKSRMAVPRRRLSPLPPNLVRLTFLPERQTVEFERGKLPYQDHGKPGSILDIALNFGLHLEHACGGNCACTTCHVVVKKGKELLSDMDDDEADRLDMAADLQLDSRLGCQAVIEKPGEVVVEIPAWNRNYVSESGD